MKSIIFIHLFILYFNIIKICKKCKCFYVKFYKKAFCLDIKGLYLKEKASNFIRLLTYNDSFVALLDVLVFD